MITRLIIILTANYLYLCECRSIGNSNSLEDNNIYKHWGHHQDLWKPKYRGYYDLNPRQDINGDGGSVIGILTPNPTEDLPPSTPEPEIERNYLPNLNFWVDLGELVLGRSSRSLSPFVRLSRVLFESQQCAELVSCRVSRMSKQHSPLQFLHSFLNDFPFDGDLAKRLKMGSEMSEVRDDCGFNCSPFKFLNQGIDTLNLLHKVMNTAST